ncbi:M61 family metallopeptidase [Granulicella arctica]|uniref:M61 family metallopeptidase n=1 Tax=Granulicella arctica TaxID=940613 RepID=UPI0021E0025B|nr:PDZ domain-containing protein [Granulicella arctica]
MLTRMAVLSFALSVGVTYAQKPIIQITADLSDAPRKLYHAEVDIPVTAGPLALTTPKWIPGHHSPNGPVADITGVVFTANGKTLPWRRDDVDLYQYRLVVPAGVTSLHAHLDCIVTSRITTNMAVLEWEKLLLYPAGISVARIPIQATVIVPTGWGIGTSLKPISAYDPQHPVGGTVHYAATTVEMLEDSPIQTGQYFHEYALAPEVSPKHYIDLFGDEAEDVQLRPAVLAHMDNLIREAGAMYNSHHYTSYHFLLTLTQKGGGGGLEHHESSDNGLPEHAFFDEQNEMINFYLLAHEFTHSWNGKYRRPIGLATPDYAMPMQGQLLWVYEGLTDYLGNVLGTRSGFTTQEYYRGYLALLAAQLDYKAGRQWRSTEDTAISVSALRGSPAWANWRRSTDYYQEGDLLWLDADTTIRKLTDNKKNLHDFLAIFLGKGGETAPMVVPYDVNELAVDLNQVVKYDWAGFLRDHVDKINQHADLTGIEQGGYKLIYTDKPTAYEKSFLSLRGGGIDVWFSLGISIDADGTITDVQWDGPASKAKLVPGEKIMAVNGRIFSKDALLNAVKQTKGSTEPLRLILQNDTLVTTADIDYHDGARYPALVRVDGLPDYLDDITKAMTIAPSKAE